MLCNTLLFYSILVNIKNVVYLNRLENQCLVMSHAHYKHITPGKKFLGVFVLMKTLD